MLLKEASHLAYLLTAAPFQLSRHHKSLKTKSFHQRKKIAFLFRSFWAAFPVFKEVPPALSFYDFTDRGWRDSQPPGHIRLGERLTPQRAENNE